MFGIGDKHRLYLYDQVCDMRKGFDGLSGIVQSKLGRDPTDGCIYIFINRRKNRMKLLEWQSSGFMLYYKRLEQGTFEFDTSHETKGGKQLEYEDLVMLLSGIKLHQKYRRKRYKKEDRS